MKKVLHKLKQRHTISTSISFDLYAHYTGIYTPVCCASATAKGAVRESNLDGDEALGDVDGAGGIKDFYSVHI